MSVYEAYNTSPCEDDGHGYWVILGPRMRNVFEAGSGRKGKRLAHKIAIMMNLAYQQGLDDGNKEPTQ